MSERRCVNWACGSTAVVELRGPFYREETARYERRFRCNQCSVTFWADAEPQRDPREEFEQEVK